MTELQNINANFEEKLTLTGSEKKELKKTIFCSPRRDRVLFLFESELSKKLLSKVSRNMHSKIHKENTIFRRQKCLALSDSLAYFRSRIKKVLFQLLGLVCLPCRNTFGHLILTLITPEKNSKQY